MSKKPLGNSIGFNIPTPWVGNSHRLQVKLFSIGLMSSILIMGHLCGIPGILDSAEARTRTLSPNYGLKLPVLKDSIKFQKKLPLNAFQAGQQAYLTGDYEEAVDNFLLAATKNPYNPNITYFLADCYVKLNQYDLAKVYYHKTLFLNPTSSAGTLALMALEAIDTYNLKYSPFYPLPHETSSSFDVNSPSDESEMLSRPSAGNASVNSFKLNTNPIPPEPLHSVTPKLQGAVSSAEMATTKRDNYLNYVAEDGVLVRWGEEQLPLKIYISPLADRQELIALAKEAMGAWQVASKDKIRYEITEEPLMADIQVLWAPFIGLMNIEGENFYKEGNTQLKSQGARVYHEVQIATYDMEHHPNSTTTLYHTLVHEFGHALGLRGHSDDPHDVMYFSKVPNQKGQLSQRDINTIRQLYDIRISNEP